MILNDQEYEFSLVQLGKFKDAVAEAEERTTDRPWFHDTEVNGMKSLISDLEKDTLHYALLKSGETVPQKVHSLEKLPTALIETRIASGLSQADLAEEMGVTVREMQRLEDSEYTQADLGTIIRVANLVSVHIEDITDTDSTRKRALIPWENLAKIDWELFPASEMVKRKYFDLQPGADIMEATKTYLTEAAGMHLASVHHRKKVRGNKPPNHYALLAWQSRVLQRAESQIKEQHLQPIEFSRDWLRDLVRLSQRDDGPECVPAFLADKGIAFVIEKHLARTYLDGAAMLSREGYPIIAMTLRHDRWDNFWFVLLHEIGHIFLHLLKGIQWTFFDDAQSRASDLYESEADQFALDALIPEDQWDQCISRFALTPEAVRCDAERLGIAESIIAGRIRNEQQNYRLLNTSIRTGIRRQLKFA